ncbi:MAG: DUF5652 family protein [Patescibacteria group bacterium]
MESVLVEQFFVQNSWVLWLIILWTFPWKAVAMWKAARNSHKGWFVALLIINTVGILDILYIFVFGKIKNKAVGGQNQS